MRTAGHSVDGLSYRLGETMFIEDAIPVRGDIPIMISESEMRKTLQRFGQITGVHTFYPAWDTIYSAELMRRKLREALTDCFASEAYQAIMQKRIGSVDARGLIVEGDL